MKRAGTIATLAATALLVASSAVAQPPRQDAIWARSTAGAPIVLDGNLNEPAWALAEPKVIDWGVDAGDLYRPKGVAFDEHGEIWVSDSVLGAIQVFADTGELIAVAAEDDRVRHFRTPTRLAFDELGRLAVVEMRADRISLWTVAE